MPRDQKLGLTNIYISGGMTGKLNYSNWWFINESDWILIQGILQPADVCWFRSLKIHYTTSWDHWLEHSEKHYTKNSNMVGPGYDLVVRLIINCWNNLKLDTIINKNLSLIVVYLILHRLIILNWIRYCWQISQKIQQS